MLTEFAWWSMWRTLEAAREEQQIWAEDGVQGIIIPEDNGWFSVYLDIEPVSFSDVFGRGGQ